MLKRADFPILEKSITVRLTKEQTESFANLFKKEENVEKEHLEKFTQFLNDLKNEVVTLRIEDGFFVEVIIEDYWVNEKAFDRSFITVTPLTGSGIKKTLAFYIEEIKEFLNNLVK